MVHTTNKSEGEGMKKWNWILYVLLGIILLIIGISFLVLSSNLKKEGNKYYDELATKEKTDNIQNSINSINTNYIDNTDVVITSYSKFKISPNTKIVFETFYKKCNHKFTVEQITPNELVNLNEEELKTKYKDYDIKLFSVEKVILYKEIDEYCGSHFALRESEGVIAVYKINNNGKEEIMDLTDISVQYLPETDKLNLKTGIKIYGEENLDKALEDFE